MGCIPSKSSLTQPKHESKSEMRIVARTLTRGSSIEQLSQRPRSPSSIETKVPETAHSEGLVNAPLPPRPDCIAPRPKPSEESLRRRKEDADQGHANEGGASATAAAVVVAGGAAVHADGGANASGGGDAGGGGGDAGGDGGGGE